MTVPFLASLSTGDAPVRPLAASLPTREAAPAQSPWTPSLVIEVAGEAREDVLAAARAEAAALRAEAIEAGRAEGRRELDAQRAQLTALVAELTRTRDARDTAAATAIATASVAVIEAWLGRAITGAERFAPIVRGWIAAGAATGAIARVNPADVDAMRAAVGDAPIEVAGDAAIVAGDVRISAGARELDHCWTERLAELREAIAAAGANAAEPPST